MTSVSLRILTLFFLLAVGAFARYRNIIKDETTDSLINIVLKIALPFLYFYSLSSHATPEALRELWFLPVSAVVIVALGYVIGLIASRFLNLGEAKKKTFLFMTSFVNYGFLAIPIVYMLFGEEGLFQIIIFNIGFNILFWTFGMWLLGNNKTNPVKNLINPGTISLALGLLVGLFSLKVPVFITDASRLLGNGAIPLAMLTVGAILSRSLGKRAMKMPVVTALSLSRLIIVPVMILFILSFIKDMPFIAKAIIVLQAAMPSPAMTPLIARKFGGDPEFASTGVFFTTLFSLITVSLFMHLVGA